MEYKVNSSTKIASYSIIIAIIVHILLLVLLFTSIYLNKIIACDNPKLAKQSTKITFNRPYSLANKPNLAQATLGQVLSNITQNNISQNSTSSNIQESKPNLATNNSNNSQNLINSADAQNNSELNETKIDIGELDPASLEDSRGQNNSLPVSLESSSWKNNSLKEDIKQNNSQNNLPNSMANLKDNLKTKTSDLKNNPQKLESLKNIKQLSEKLTSELNQDFKNNIDQNQANLSDLSEHSELLESNAESDIESGLETEISESLETVNQESQNSNLEQSNLIKQVGLIDQADKNQLNQLNQANQLNQINKQEEISDSDKINKNYNGYNPFLVNLPKVTRDTKNIKTAENTTQIGSGIREIRANRSQENYHSNASNKNYISQDKKNNLAKNRLINEQIERKKRIAQLRKAGILNRLREIAHEDFISNNYVPDYNSLSEAEVGDTNSQNYIPSESQQSAIIAGSRTSNIPAKYRHVQERISYWSDAHYQQKVCKAILESARTYPKILNSPEYISKEILVQLPILPNGQLGEIDTSELTGVPSVDRVILDILKQAEYPPLPNHIKKKVKIYYKAIQIKIELNQGQNYFHVTAL